MTSGYWTLNVRRGSPRNESAASPFAPAPCFDVRGIEGFSSRGTSVQPRWVGARCSAASPQTRGELAHIAVDGVLCDRELCGRGRARDRMLCLQAESFCPLPG